MANRMRYRHGQQSLRKLAVASATVIEQGDLVWMNTSTSPSTIKPASDFTWDTNLATTQASFAALFVGVALTSSASGETDPVTVDVSPLSVYEYACPSGTYDCSDPMGPDENSSALADQQLEIAAKAAAVAYVAEPVTTAATSVLVSFASAYFPVNVNTNVG